MKNQDSDRQETIKAQIPEPLDVDLEITSTMLQLVDYVLPDQDENVGVDPYNNNRSHHVQQVEGQAKQYNRR